MVTSSNLNGHQTRSETLVLQYAGKATTIQIDLLLDLLEKMLISEGIANGLRRRLYSIAMETLQNLSTHVPDQLLDTINDLDINPYTIKFLFEGAHDKFKIETSNYVLRHNLDALMAKIDYINTLDEGAKKEYYNYLIKNLPFSEKGGAGLGLVDIARKSKKPLKYLIQDANSYYALVTLSVTIEAETVPVSIVNQ